jgi:hypothetical protein
VAGVCRDFDCEPYRPDSPRRERKPFEFFQAIGHQVSSLGLVGEVAGEAFGLIREIGEDVTDEVEPDFVFADDSAILILQVAGIETDLLMGIG